MPAYVQASKRKLDLVDASASSTSRKHVKLSTTSNTFKSTASNSFKPTSTSEIAPQPPPNVWGQGGKASATLFASASQRLAKPLIAVPLTKTATAAVKPVAPKIVAPVVQPKTSPIKVASFALPTKAVHPSCPLSHPSPRKASTGAALPPNAQEIQPRRSISPAGSDTSVSSASTAYSSSSWRSQASTTSATSSASQSSWRTGPRNAAPASAPRLPLASAPVAGQICWLPRQPDIAAGEPIHQHPDFKNNSNAFNHPCLVVKGPDAKGYLTCYQTTSFGQTGGLLAKYADKGSRSMANQRNRWLLIECNGKMPNHDDQPMLSYQQGVVGCMPKPTYVNCEKWFKIRPSDLTVKGSVVKLSMHSVQTVEDHHHQRYTGTMNNALHNNPGLMP